MRIITILSFLVVPAFLAGTQVHALEGHSIALKGKMYSDAGTKSTQVTLYRAKLSGDEVVPQVRSSARGFADFTPIEGGDAVRFRLRVVNVENMAGAYLHLGPRGSNGSMVANLTKVITGFHLGFLPGMGPMNLYIQGVIESGDLKGDLEGKPVSDLVDKMNAGLVYVNVMTLQNPAGEVRGQVQ